MDIKKMSTLSLVLGIVCAVGALCPVFRFAAPFVSVVGVIFGALALKKLKAEGTDEGKTKALVAVIIGIVAFIESSIIFGITIPTCVAGEQVHGLIPLPMNT